MSNKEIVIEAIRQLPELVSFEEIAEEIAILAAIQRGEHATPTPAESSRTTTSRRGSTRGFRNKLDRVGIGRSRIDRGLAG